MGLTRREILLRRKLKLQTAVCRHRPRREIERAMVKTVVNQLRAEIAADKRGKAA